MSESKAPFPSANLKRRRNPPEAEQRRIRSHTIEPTLQPNVTLEPEPSIQIQSDLVLFRKSEEIESETVIGLSRIISESGDIRYDFAKCIGEYLGRPPKIQFWNVYPYGRATIRSHDHKIYILAGKKGLIGPLDLKDEKTSIPLNAVELFAHRATVEEGQRNRLRFVARLKNIAESKIVTWDTSEDKMGQSPTKLTFLKDKEDNVITDAASIISMRNQFAVSTGSGHVYQNLSEFKGSDNVISITSDEGGFATIDEKGNPVVSNLTRWWFIGEQNQTMRLSRRATTCVSNGIHFAFLLENGRILIETNKPSRNFGGGFSNTVVKDQSLIHFGLNQVLLQTPSARVKSLTASSHHFAALLQYANGSQEVYIWGPPGGIGLSIPDSSDLFRDFFAKKRVKHKSILNIVGSSPKILYSTVESSFGSEDRAKYIPVFAVNFDNNTSYLIMKSGPRIIPVNENVQTIYPAEGKILVQTTSGSYIEADMDITITITIKSVVSVASTYAGYVIVYSSGKYAASKGSEVPDDIRGKIISAGGIAEIYSDQLFYCAIMKNGTIVTWSAAS